MSRPPDGALVCDRGARSQRLARLRRRADRRSALKERPYASSQAKDPHRAAATRCQLARRAPFRLATASRQQRRVSGRVSVVALPPGDDSPRCGKRCAPREPVLRVRRSVRTGPASASRRTSGAPPPPLGCGYEVLLYLFAGVGGSEVTPLTVTAVTSVQYHPDAAFVSLKVTCPLEPVVPLPTYDVSAVPSSLTL